MVRSSPFPYVTRPPCWYRMRTHTFLLSSLLICACRTPPLTTPDIAGNGGIAVQTDGAVTSEDAGSSALLPPGCSMANVACLAGAATCCPWILPQSLAPCPNIDEGNGCIYWASDGHTSAEPICFQGQWHGASYGRSTQWDYSAECGDGLRCLHDVDFGGVQPIGCVVPSACLRCTCFPDGLYHCEHGN
jgi:hypothetical protein